MPKRHSYLHVHAIIGLLRQAAADNATTAMNDERGGLGSCLGAALANDAADALQGFLDQSIANAPADPAAEPLVPSSAERDR